ncbi:aminopeptidase [Methylobacterium sp. ID0610]|uniref:aminopeptidase n=1 Tax=Methylobacterium carpenticola TaxID=3344827 RepID=UPI0036AF77E6
MKAMELQRCARIAVEMCGSVKPGERVLVVTDTMRDQSVAQALMAAAMAAEAEPVLVVMPTRRSSPQEPPAAVRAAMQEADLTFLYTTYSLTHSSARVAAQKAGARVITMPGVTEDGFLRTLSVDMDRLVALTNRLAERVARARTARVTTELGTDMRYELEHPLATLDGVAKDPGDLDAFPPGLFLSVPRARSASGVAVVDGSITQIGRVTSPVTMSFEDGRLVSIKGGSEAARLSNLLASLDDPNAYAFAAWGIGTNPGAALIGEDPSFEGERIYGWTHVSTGSSATLPGGTVRAKIHLDGIIGRPTIYLDEEMILDSGKFVGEFAEA